MIQAPKVCLIHVFLALYGLPVDTQGLGPCFIILEPQLIRVWEKMLSNQGFSCVFNDLDGCPAVFVPLKPMEVMN